MNKIAISFLSAFLLLGNIVIAQRSNCSAYPEPIRITQPDGSSLRVYMKGGEMLHYYETIDGYTVLQNPAHNGTYEYATLDEKGDLIPAGIPAKQQITGAVQKKGSSITKGLKYSSSQVAAAKKSFYAHSGPVKMGKAANGDFPAKGKMKLLVVLMQFQDEPAIYLKQDFVDLLTQEGYNKNGGTGSFRDFYKDNSFGQFELDITVLGWYTSARNRIEYGQNDAQGNPNSNYYSNVQELVGQAVDSAEQEGIDFSEFDNNKDGELDGLVVFHSGFGAEEGKNGYIWSHRYNLWGGSNKFYDGVNISNYCINPAKRTFGGTTQVRIGVVTHEFGHILGLPDLYDTDYSSEGAGNWCLMAGGPWMNEERTPCQLSSWSKSELGWFTPTVIGNAGTYSLKNTTDSNTAYRINTSSSSEYFLLENRQRKGWDSYLPGEGLAIWHIDKTIADRYSLFQANDVNADSSKFGVGLMQADGLRHLERGTNRGDAGDLYPGTSNNRSFTPVSKPASLLHLVDINGDRVRSNVHINKILLQDSIITFDIGAVTYASFVPSVTTGCSPLTVSFTNQSNQATSYKWTFGDVVTDIVSPEVTFTGAGTFSASLVAIDSVSMTTDTFQTSITVKESPVAGFELTRDSFNLSFKNTSTGATSYKWKFGKNIGSNAVEPKVTVPGPVSFYLVAFAANGCTDTAYGNVWHTAVNELASSNISLSIYPNPYDNIAAVSYELKEDNLVTLTIYNLLGEAVHTQHLGMMNAGQHEINLDKNVLPVAGVYLLKLNAGQHTGIQRIMRK